MLPACADFTQPFPLPRPERTPSRVVVFFPGSTIGNFDPPGRHRAHEGHAAGSPAASSTRAHSARPVHASAGRRPGHRLRSGERPCDPGARLRRLRRRHRGIQSERAATPESRPGGGFRSAGLSGTRPIWVPEASRIEMRLVSNRGTNRHDRRRSLSFAADEPIITEHCHKYTPRARSPPWPVPPAGRPGRPGLTRGNTSTFSTSNKT